MDSFDRQILVRQLGRALDELSEPDVDEMPACAWFWSHEMYTWLVQRETEPQSDLYAVTAAAEKLGFDVADVYYDEDDPSAIVIESFGRRARKPQPPV